jgi:hypothetical protein
MGSCQLIASTPHTRNACVDSGGFKTINISSGSEVGVTIHERPEALRSSDREVE